MFPDNEIARKMTILEDKSTVSLCHSLPFDESLNKKIQLGQMNLFVNFWNASKELAETPYFTSQFLGGAKADDNLEKFETEVSKKIYKADDLLQIPSDDPNVDLLFIKFYGEKRCLNELPALLDIGTCGFHYGSFHGSLKNTEKASNGLLEKFLGLCLKFL